MRYDQGGGGSGWEGGGEGAEKLIHNQAQKIALELTDEVWPRRGSGWGRELNNSSIIRLKR